MMAAAVCEGRAGEVAAAEVITSVVLAENGGCEIRATAA